jgi:hypothetical protein
VANNEPEMDADLHTGSVSALFGDSTEADGALAELRLRGFLPEEINVSVHAWSSRDQVAASEVDDVPVVFDPAIPPDERMGGGRILGIGKENSLAEEDIAQAADMVTGSTMQSTVRLTVRADDARRDLARTILEAHGGAPDA